MVFRKIINILVLIPYVKIIIKSSFAVDADFGQAQTPLKLSVNRLLDEQKEVKALNLSVQESDILKSQQHIIHQVDLLSAKRFSQSASNFTFNGRGGQIETMDLCDRARFINQTRLLTKIKAPPPSAIEHAIKSGENLKQKIL
ncbi:hypothetical protein [Candidatus Odyssella acanthamoebae]|uniref:Uncharacterized protein n=1 Tax=Candidatus Odyssella acanthamoebae TaxID=91604 RepID=A0A077AUA1_9PROT|nr:hypothetical protein [Candidatus Paracaedibacter acanthamoebae]AIK95604.1 hypothetical protein ID47_00775 [Candidatus Paracaedibacter acanthamoebae]